MSNSGKNTFETYRLESIDEKSPTNPDLSYENDFRKRIPASIVDRATLQLSEYLKLSDSDEKRKWAVRNAGTLDYIKEADELVSQKEIGEIFEMLDEKEPPIRSIDKYRLAAFCDLLAGTDETKH